MWYDAPLILHCVSKNVPLRHCPQLRQILTDFQTFYFADTFGGKFAIVIIKYATIPSLRRYTTLWNTNFQKSL